VKVARSFEESLARPSYVRSLQRIPRDVFEDGAHSVQSTVPMSSILTKHLPVNPNLLLGEPTKIAASPLTIHASPLFSSGVDPRPAQQQQDCFTTYNVKGNQWYYYRLRLFAPPPTHCFLFFVVEGKKSIRPHPDLPTRRGCRSSLTLLIRLIKKLLR
jgi:hypothetical protein